MKSLLRFAFSALLLCGFVSPALAQLSGTISVPSASYPTLDSVVKLLNAQGVGTGGLTVTLTAGETAPANGYKLGSAVLNASLSATKPLTINGGSYTITGQTGNSGFDVVFALLGTDYVTLNGLNISANSGSSSAEKIEIGIGVLKLNGTAPYDGCQNVTVSNCSILLSNIAGGTGIYAGHVYFVRDTAFDAPFLGAVAADANSNNTFKRNTISGMTQGIVCAGMDAPGAWDYNNTIGGALPADGNTITNGPNAAAPNAFAVYVNYDSTLTVQNNSFPSTVLQNGRFYNMYLGQSKGNVDISNNSFNVTSSGASSAQNASGFYTPGGVSGYQDPTGRFTFSGNRLTGSNTSATSTYLNGFYIFGINAAVANINNNTIENIQWGTSTHSGNIYLMYFSQGGADSLIVTGNQIRNIKKNGASSGQMFGYYLFNNTAAGGKFTYEYNKLRNVQTNYYLYGHYVYMPSTNVQTFTSKHNTLDSVHMSGTGTTKYVQNFWDYYGLNSEVAYDTIKRLSVNSGSLSLNNYWTYYAKNPNVHHNLIDSLELGGTSATCANYVYYSRDSGSYHDNIIRNVNMTSGTFYGAHINTNALVGSFNTYNNLITNNKKTGAGAGVHHGLYFAGVGDFNTYNNTITDLNVNSSYTGSATGLIGIYIVSSKSNHNLYNNTIKIATTGSASTFNATGVYYANNALQMVELRNNLIHVDCTPAGTGTVVALRRASGTNNTAPVNLSLNTNNNVYYTPNIANSFWYGEGTTTTTLVNKYNTTTDASINSACSSTYKAFMAPRERNTFVENNISAVGTAGYYAPSGSSYAKKGGVSITGLPAIGADAAGVTRPSLPDVGALQFTGTANDAAGPNITFLSTVSNSYCISAPVIKTLLTDASGVAQGTGVSPRLYYRKTTDANTFGVTNTSAGNGWKWVEATSISGDTFTFSPDFSKLQAAAALGNTITYFVAAQDSATTPAVSYKTVGFVSTYCPSSVALTGAPSALAAPAVNQFSFLSLPTFAINANYTTHCESGASLLRVTPTPLGTTIVWENSTDGTTFNTIAGATDSFYNTPVLSNTTYYRAKVYCGGSTLIGTTTVTTINLVHPVLSSSIASADRCGEGTVSLSATAPAGTSIGWYTDSASKNPIAVGATYVPYVKDSTRFYVGAFLPNADRETTGAQALGYSNTTTTSYGVAISLKKPTNIYKTTVYATGVGSMSVGLYDSAGVNLISTSATTQINGSGATPGVAVEVPLNFLNVPAGHYILRPAVISGSPALLYRYIENSPFPIVSASKNFTIEAGWLGQRYDEYYCYFFDIETSADCVSPKALVQVNVRPAPAIDATSAKQPGICLGQTDTVSVTTANTGYTFSWSSGQTASSFAVSPTSDATYIVTATDQSGTAFGGCVSKDTVKIPVSLPPTAPTISPSASTICAGGVSVLKGTPGQLGSGGNSVGPFTIGTGTITNYEYDFPAVYGRSYTGGRTQMLVLASELTAAGLTAGKLKSLAFDVTRLNAFDNSDGFTIGLMATTISQLSATTMVSGATQVFTRASETPSLGWNTYTFTTPFDWDGTSNIIVDAYFTNCTGCIPGDFTCNNPTYAENASQNQTATSFRSTAVIYEDYSSCDMGANTRVYESFKQRPNMRFTAEAPIHLSWNPVSGLFKDTTLMRALIGVDSNHKVFASPNATTTYTAVSNYRGCKSGVSNTATVTVTPTPTVTTTVSPSRKVCAGATINLSIPNGGTGITYQWYNGATPIAGATTNSYVATASGAYTVLATNTASGCSRRSVVENLLVSPFPVATVTAITPNPICAPGTVTLSANAGANRTYQWQKAGVNVTGATMVNYVADSTNGYRVIVTDTATTCSATSNVLTATINRINTELSFSGPTALCTGNTVTLSVPAAASQTYVWKNSGVAIAGANTNSYTATATGNYRVVIGNTATGCSDSSSIVPVIVGPAPTSNITPANSAAICQNDSVRLATNTGFNLTYTWYRNGTVIAGATDSVYNATVAGAYKVKVASDPTCATTTVNATTVTVNPLPVASISAGGPTTFCDGNSVTFTGNSGSGLGYQWQRNDTAISGATLVNYVASTTGSYSVRVTDGNGCSRNALSSVVTVNPLPTATVSVTGFSTVCQGDAVMFSANAGTGLTYQWMLGGTNIAGATSSTYSALTAGNYSVRVTNGFGCNKVSAATTATVNPRPVVTITPGATANLCAGSSLTLVGTPVPGSFYQWSLGGSPILGATTSSYTATGGGSYRLRITNSITGCKDSATTVVTSVALPIVSITAAGGSTSPICSNDSITLNASGAGSGLTYQWNKNGSPLGGLAAQSSSFKILGSLGSGAYTVSASNYAGCVGVSPAFNLVVNPSPITLITYSAPLTFCQGSAVVLNTQTTEDARLNWYRNGVLVVPADTNRYRSIYTSGTYNVRATSPGGCNYTSGSVTVVVNPLPQPVITRTNNILFAGPGTYVAYQWYKNNVAIAGETNSSYKPLADAGYSVRVTDANGCENTSETFAYGTVSVVGMSKEGIRLYPNPTNGMVKVESPVAVDISVRDATGRLVRMVKNATEVDFADLADGLYLVYLTDAKTQQLLLTEKVSKVSR